MVQDVYLLHLKSPAESHADYDWNKVIATIPGDKVFRPIDAAGGCPAFAKK
jgi:branched-chain amino acid transport system substrate-binding protein